VVSHSNRDLALIVSRSPRAFEALTQQAVLTSAITEVSAVPQASAVVTLATVAFPVSLSAPTSALDKVDALREDACASQASLVAIAPCQVAVLGTALVMFLALVNVMQAGVALSAPSSWSVQIRPAQAMAHAVMDPAIAKMVGMAQGVQPPRVAACPSAGRKANATCTASNASVSLATWGPTALSSLSHAQRIATIRGFA